jgi:hypothetical protein
MKKTGILCLLLLCLWIGTAWAAENGSQNISGKTAAILQGENNLAAESNSKLPQVMVLYINNAKTDYNGEIDAKIMEHLKTVAANRWVLMPGDVYKDKLASMGIQSITTAERADIMAATKDAEADAIMMIEVEPFNIRDVITFFTVGKKVTASIPVKVIDRNTNMYLYNGKFVEMAQDNSMIGGIGNKSVIMKALDQIFDKFDMIIPEKLVNVKHTDKELKPAI